VSVNHNFYTSFGFPVVHDDSNQCIVNIVYCSYCGFSDKIIMLVGNMCADVGETSSEH